MHISERECAVMSKFGLDKPTPSISRAAPALSTSRGAAGIVLLLGIGAVGVD